MLANELLISRGTTSTEIILKQRIVESFSIYFKSNQDNGLRWVVSFFFFLALNWKTENETIKLKMILKYLKKRLRLQSEREKERDCVCVFVWGGGAGEQDLTYRRLHTILVPQARLSSLTNYWPTKWSAGGWSKTISFWIKHQRKKANNFLRVKAVDTIFIMIMNYLPFFIPVLLFW